MGLRVATWNLERPAARSWQTVPRQRARMAALDADIWVLTETRASIAPSDRHEGVHAGPLPGWSRDDDERMISIWSRWPIELEPVDHDPRTHIAARIDHPEGRMLVCGVVIPWANDKGPDGDATMWERHAQVIPVLGATWRTLRDRWPEAPMVVAGDFNQDRDGSGWYGTHRVRDLLTHELAAAGLHLLTDTDVVADGLLDGQHLVDHIAVTRPLPRDGWRLELSPTRDDDGVRLSDHPTVVVTHDRLRWPLPHVEDIDWRPVMEWLPALETAGPDRWLVPTGPDRSGWPQWTDDAQRLMEVFHEQHVVAGFDWPSWFDLHGRRLYDLGEFDDVSADDCRRLLVAILRGDRFNDGVYVEALQNGMIGRLVRRIAAELDLDESPRDDTHVAGSPPGD
jgi:hypothetical protein